MRVYHFLEKQWAIESLLYERLKVSLFSDMNDPFELLGVSLNKKSDRDEFQKLKKEVSEEMGAICFSRKWENPVLWSHYANKHSGIVLGFDILTEHAKSIAYTGERLGEEIVNSFHSEEDEDLTLKLLTTKYEHWKYENEVRILLKLTDVHKIGGLFFLPYCNALKLKEIIIGPRCEISKNQVERIIPKSQTPVKITFSRLAFRSFKVVKNLKKSKNA